MNFMVFELLCLDEFYFYRREFYENTQIENFEQIQVLGDYDIVYTYLLLKKFMSNETLY